MLKNEYYGHALEKIPPIKARHPDPDKDKDNDMRRKSKCNLQFVETKCNFGSLRVAFTFSLQFTGKFEKNTCQKRNSLVLYTGTEVIRLGEMMRP